MTETAPTPPRIPPTITDDNRAFWTSGADGTLMMSFCEACERYFHPPAGECPECGGEARPQAVSGRGTVYTYTVNHHPYHPDVPPPYVIALVELEEQPDLKFTTNVVDCAIDEVEIGLAVKVRFEPAGDAWVPVFAPDA